MEIFVGFCCIAVLVLFAIRSIYRRVSGLYIFDRVVVGTFIFLFFLGVLLSIINSALYCLKCIFKAIGGIL